jgi:methylmalonyl-CoA mutase C-terminal domain
MHSRRIRVLIAKPGLDGHDRGAKVVAQGLRDAGMEVIYLGSRLTPEQIAQAAIQEDVDVVGLSCLSGAHMALFPKTVRLIKERSDKNILFICGGIIPEKDLLNLKKSGIAQIFGPGTPLSEISKFIEEALRAKSDDCRDWLEVQNPNKAKEE